MSKEIIQDQLDAITLDTSRISCFACFIDDEADKVSDYDNDLSEQLFSLADALKVYAKQIDDKVIKLYDDINELLETKNNLSLNNENE